MGAGKSLNGRQKNWGKKNSRTRGRARVDKVLTDRFQMVGVVLLGLKLFQSGVIFHCTSQAGM